MEIKSRLESSTQWTQLPKDWCKEVENLLTSQLKKTSNGKDLSPGSFHVLGRVFPQEILLVMGRSEKSRLFQKNIFISFDIEFEEASDKTQEKLFKAVDVGALLLEKALSVRDKDFIPTLLWEEYEYEEILFYNKWDTQNTMLEIEANKILGISDEALINETEDSENTESIEAILKSLNKKNHLDS